MGTMMGAALALMGCAVLVGACAGAAPGEETATGATAPPTNVDPAAQPVLPACGEVCALGLFQCESKHTARVCERDERGCPTWTKIPCVVGAQCEGDVPVCLGGAPSCENPCPLEGAKTCAGEGGAGVLVCARTATGCLGWEPAADCGAGTSCDAQKNDGTCVAGCKDDVDCDATKIDRTRCSASKTASQRCVKDGACHRWKTEKVVPQQCTGVGAYACSGLSAKRSCKISFVGACLAHETTVTACESGSICVGSGSCEVVCPPSDGCDGFKVGTQRCKSLGSAGRQTCQKETNGCYRWVDSASCVNGTTCSAGKCG